MVVKPPATLRGASVAARIRYTILYAGHRLAGQGGRAVTSCQDPFSGAVLLGKYRPAIDTIFGPSILETRDWVILIIAPLTNYIGVVKQRVERTIISPETWGLFAIDANPYQVSLLSDPDKRRVRCRPYVLSCRRRQCFGEGENDRPSGGIGFRRSTRYRRFVLSF